VVQFGDEGVVVFGADELREFLREELEAKGEAVGGPGHLDPDPPDGDVPGAADLGAAVLAPGRPAVVLAERETGLIGWSSLAANADAASAATSTPIAMSTNGNVLRDALDARWG